MAAAPQIIRAQLQVAECARSAIRNQSFRSHPASDTPTAAGPAGRSYAGGGGAYYGGSVSGSGTMCAHCHVKPRFKEPTGKVHPYCGKGCGAKAKAAGGSAPASYGAPQSTVNGGPPRPGYQQAPAGGGFRATAAAGVGAPPPHSAYTPYNFGAGMGGMQQPQYGMGGVGGMQQPFGMQQPQHAMGGMQPFGMGGVQQPQQPVPVGPVSPMQPAQASSLQGPAASGGGYPAGS